MPELFLYLLSIISFCASPSYCLLPLAYQSVSSRLCQLSFQALWPSSSTFSVSALFLFSSLSLSSHWHFSFSCLFLPLSRSLYHQLPPPPIPLPPRPSHTHTHTLSLSSFIFHLCQSPWSCLRESNPPSNSSFYSSYSHFDSRSYSFLYSSPLCSVFFCCCCE